MSDEEVTLDPNITAETTPAEVMEAYIGERLKSFLKSFGWVEIDIGDFCSVCGQWVRPKGRGSHRRKHKGEIVTYSWLHPDATGVDLLLTGYTPSGE